MRLVAVLRGLDGKWGGLYFAGRLYLGFSRHYSWRLRLTRSAGTLVVEAGPLWLVWR